MSPLLFLGAGVLVLWVVFLWPVRVKVDRSERCKIPLEPPQ
jgi:hypothetical protein